MRLTLLLFLQVFTLSVHAAQEPAKNFEHERQQVIAEVVKNIGLQNNFIFLQSQGLVDQSFEDYLQKNVPQVESEQELDVDLIIRKAENVVTKHLKDNFLFRLKIAMEQQKTLNFFKNDSLFTYVMKHKNDYMHEMTTFWLYEWSKTQDDYEIYPLTFAAVTNSHEVATLLIEAKSDVNIKSNYDYSPLQGTAENDSKQVAEILIAAGADVNIKDKDHMTPLIVAAQNNSKEVAKLLIAAGADLNAQDTIFGHAPLMWAALHDSKEIAEILIAADADVNIQNSDGEIPEQLAYTHEMIAIFEGARNKKENKHFWREDPGCTIS